MNVDSEVKEDKTIIPIDVAKDLFKTFLGKNNNKRIFFSARFGSGKTYFLKDFFESHKQEYDCYHLYPIKYQIFENYDVIDLIKYDILFSVLERMQLNFKGELRKQKLTAVSRSILQFVDKKKLIEAIPKLGKSVSVTLEVFKDASKLYNDSKDPISAQLQELEESKSGEVVNKLNSVLKSEINICKGNKKSVLILDDLDRMDPEHIFRILNIMSAMMESEEDNQWDFDHVILVGDVDNIRHYFYHKYGDKADFQGYFDKFSSITPSYNFDIVQAVMQWIDTEMMKFIKHNDDLESDMQDYAVLNSTLKMLFKEFIENKYLNLRQLYKPVKNELPSLSTGISKSDLGNSGIRNSTELDDINKHKCIVRGFELLTSLLTGGKKELIEALEGLKNNSEKEIPESDKDRILLSKYIQDQNFYDTYPSITYKEFYTTLIEYVQKNL